MYHVLVSNSRTNEKIDARDFAFGTFQEIGFWLDYAGYISADYSVMIIMSEEAN